MGLTVRRISAKQGSLLRELRLAALADSPEAFGQRLDHAAAQPDAEWAATARAASAGDRRTWLIAWDDDRPVGMVQGRRRPPHDCLLFSMWVAPQARRGGTGRALVEAIAAWGAGWGARKVVLWVITGNDGALEFYRRLGFRLLERGPDAESGAAYGALALERPISAESAGPDLPAG
jgi:GNAT superfamily N-acetyltransferase